MPDEDAHNDYPDTSDDPDGWRQSTDEPDMED